MKASHDQRARQARSESNRPGVIAARAWVKSPSTTTCSGPVASISSARRLSVSSLTPVGAGAPSARNVAALPRWRSATNRVFAAGREGGSLGQQLERPLSAQPQARSRVRRLFELRHHPVDARRQRLVGQPLAKSLDHQGKRKRRRALEALNLKLARDISDSVACMRLTSSSSSSTSRSACLRSPLAGSYLRNTS